MLTKHVYNNPNAVRKENSYTGNANSNVGARETTLTLDIRVGGILPGDVEGPILPGKGTDKATLEFASVYSQKRVFNDPDTNRVKNHTPGT